VPPSKHLIEAEMSNLQSTIPPISIAFPYELTIRGPFMRRFEKVG